MLTPAQQSEFSSRGLIYLPSVLSKTDMNESSVRVYTLCKKAKCLRDDKWHAVDPHVARKLRKRVENSNAFGSSMTHELSENIGQLVDGGAIHQRTNRASVLFTLPNNLGGQTELNWHIDARWRSGFTLAGVQLFAFIDEVKSGGGGPVVVTGSHRLRMRENSGREAVRNQLSEHSFFASLFTKRPHDREELVGSCASVDGLQLELVEMTGQPGDVYLMDLWVLHTRWPNTSGSARIMLTQRFLLDSYAQKRVRPG